LPAEPRATEVVLVCMPFGPAFAPSLALSLLQAELSRHDVTSRVLYPSIRFAEIVGQHFYNGIAVEGRPAQIEMAGEWIFSAALFDRPVRDDDPYIQDVLVGHANWAHRFAARPVSAALIRRITAARRHVPAFLDWCVARIIAERPRVVGFTSVFQQHVASLAAARRLKEAMPEVVVVFGGANCEGAMGAETVRQFPFVDAAVSGEGELILPQLVARVRARETLEGLAGVRTHAAVAGGLDPAGSLSNAPGIHHMDDLPRPNYTDYMEQFQASRLDRDWTPTLYFETSRGCWWGERQHCTFCGLNGATMTYRSKSASRAVEELAEMVAAYPGCDVQVSDNILDLKYFKDVLPELARRQLGVKLFYETKANLKRDQIRLLRDAGVLEIQPGIESLSDGVLKLMRKGVSALQNVQLLKWCKELGVAPLWNILWGFPGESPEDYARMAALVPLLAHLPAPTGFSGLRLDRFSPNFMRAREMGFDAVQALPSYRHIYGFPEAVLSNLAYAFTYRLADARDVAAYVRPLLSAVRRWKRLGAGVDLFSLPLDDGRLHIWDFRPGVREHLTVLAGLDRVLYEACDEIADVTRLAATGHAMGFSVTALEVADHLGPLVERGLVVKDGGRYLALAIRTGEYVPSAPTLERLDREARVLGRSARAGVRRHLLGKRVHGASV
jgi:ribosomal peptide maturation radical SAM protein 1